MNITDKPIIQFYNLPGVKHISPINAFEEVKKGQALLLDVREAEEYASEKIDLRDVFYLPLSEFMEKHSFIPQDKPILVICASGIRSAQVVGFMLQQGNNNFINVDGGNHAMKEAGISYI